MGHGWRQPDRYSVVCSSCRRESPSQGTPIQAVEVAWKRGWVVGGDGPTLCPACNYWVIRFERCLELPDR